jgi:hypothetical protein
MREFYCSGSVDTLLAALLGGDDRNYLRLAPDSRQGERVRIALDPCGSRDRPAPPIQLMWRQTDRYETRVASDDQIPAFAVGRGSAL